MDQCRKECSLLPRHTLNPGGSISESCVAHREWEQTLKRMQDGSIDRQRLQFREDFADELTELLKDKLPKDQSKDFARTLASHCAQREPRALDEVKKILNSENWDFDQYCIDMRAEKLEELVQEYTQRTPAAVTRINKLLADAGWTRSPRMRRPKVRLYRTD